MSKTKAELKAAFDRIDSDKSGAIDIGELQDLLTAVDIPSNNVTLWKMMEQLDTNIPYGNIDFDEFYEWVQTHQASAKETEALGRTLSMPGNAEEWASRLDGLGETAGTTAVRHDVKGTHNLTEDQVLARYPLGKKLGAGKYASVHKCTDRETGDVKAMKIFYKKNRAKRKFYDVIEEANKMRRVQDHENIVKVYDLIETSERLIMLIEFVEGGQLYDEILKRKPKENGTGYFTERMAGKIIGQLTDAIWHMHKQDVLHCDLKPENVLCTHNPSTDNFDVKVADMGLSKVLERGVRQNLTYCGTPLYMAPEMLRKEQYSYPVDLWSIGCMMHELLCGDPPFTGRNMQELERNVKSYKGLNSEETAVTKRIKKQFTRYGVSELAQDLLGKYLDDDPKKRITAQDAIRHDWIAKNELLSADHMPAVQLSLTLSTEKRKFRRAVNKIVMGQKIVASIRYSREQHAKSLKKGAKKGGPGAAAEDTGCNCTTM